MGMMRDYGFAAEQQDQLWALWAFRLSTIDRQEPGYEQSASEEIPAAVARKPIPHRDALARLLPLGSGGRQQDPECGRMGGWLPHVSNRTPSALGRRMASRIRMKGPGGTIASPPS